MTDAFNLFFVKLAPLLLTDLLNQFEWCVLQDNDQLARSASSCLETLVNMPYEFLKNQNEAKVLYICIRFLLLTHESSDLSQAETIITLVKR